MNSTAMLELLKERVHQMEGGRRRVGRPRKVHSSMVHHKRPVGRPRKYGRGLVGGEGDIDGYEMHTMAEGGALVGGRRRVGRPRKGVIPPQFRAHIAALRRKKRGHGLVGGNKAQDLYDSYVLRGEEMPKEVLEYVKAGIVPMTKKEQLIKNIMLLEKRIGFHHSTESQLKKYNIKALTALQAFYKKEGRLLAYPPVQGARDEYDDEGRFEDEEYQYVSGIKAPANPIFAPLDLPEE